MAPKMSFLTVALLGAAIGAPTLLKVKADHAVTLYNNCQGLPITPYVQTGSGGAKVPYTGAQPGLLQPYTTSSVTLPNGFNGRIYGKTGCDGNGNGCATPPADNGGSHGSWLEYTLDFDGNTQAFSLGQHDYDLSHVDGFNLPLGLSFDNSACQAVSCNVDINAQCPSEIRLANGAACGSPCGPGGSVACPNGQAGPYSSFYKNLCPAAYTYPYDDATSNHGCYAQNVGMTVTFCPS